MKHISKKPLIVGALALALILGSSVGATRAAMVYQTYRDSVTFSTAEVSASLYENDSQVTDGALKFNFGDDGFKIGQKYNEVISVVNDSSEDYGYDEYVRVIVTKSWQNEDGSKDTSLDPSLIQLTINDGWVKDESASTKEREVYYLTKPLANSNEIALTSTLTIPDTVTEKITKSGTSGNITTSYNYAGKSFSISVEADAVQTHNAKDAIRGAWGIDVDVADDGTITIK